MVSKKLSDVKKEFYEIGRKDEEFVMEATEKTLGGKCERSTKQEDMFDHIDFWWDSPKKGRIGVDVKGPRRDKRKGDFNDSIQWVELKNVQGNDGWLYGKAKYIAFRTLSSIIYVDRERLLAYTLEKVGDKETVYKCPDDFYIPYQRYCRLDKVVKVPMDDLKKIASFSIEN